MLLINKTSTGWYYTINNGSQRINASKDTAIIETVANTFILMLPNGAVIPNIAEGVLDIILKDETGANVDETFTSVVALKTRLEALDFPAYLQVNAIQEIQAGANITVDNTNPLRPIISASGGGSGTDLAYTASPTNGIVTSSTGTDATLPLADGTNAGLLKPAKYTVLENTSGTNTGDQDLSGKQDVLTSANFSTFGLALDGKSTPIAGDFFLLYDSEDGGLTKIVDYANLGGGGGSETFSFCWSPNDQYGLSNNSLTNGVWRRATEGLAGWNTLINANNSVGGSGFIDVDAPIRAVPYDCVLTDAVLRIHYSGTVNRDISIMVQSSDSGSSSAFNEATNRVLLVNTTVNNGVTYSSSNDKTVNLLTVSNPSYVIPAGSGIRFSFRENVATTIYGMTLELFFKKSV